VPITFAAVGFIVPKKCKTVAGVCEYTGDAPFVIPELIGNDVDEALRIAFFTQPGIIVVTAQSYFQYNGESANGANACHRECCTGLETILMHHKSCNTSK
jgi:hypothetical protein